MLANTQPRRARSGDRPGFTLIEILVVVGIIALLVGILLPTFAAVRETARQTICMSNIREIGTAALSYAADYHDEIWRAKDWDRINDVPEGTGGEPGLLFSLVNKADRIAACPTNKRRKSNFDDDPNGNSMFNGGVDFDYTMAWRAEGVRTWTEIHAAVLVNPGAWPLHTDPPNAIINNTLITNLSGMPLYVEESTKWYNETYTDGRWSNWDQITARHDGKGSVFFLQGHVELVKFSQGPQKELVEERQDFSADDLYVHRTGRKWFRLECLEASWDQNEARLYGWLNNPHYP